MLTMLKGADQWLLDVVALTRCAPLDAVMPVISRVCDHGEIWILAALLLLIPKKTRLCGGTMLLSMLLGLLVGNLCLKPLVARARPFAETSVALLIKAPLDASFPSGHTLSSIAAATSILRQNRRWGVAAMIAAVLIAFSRLYLYVHWPSDVLAGALLGILTSLAASRLLSHLLERRDRKRLA